MSLTAIYARVSSDRQRQEQTIESQVDALREEATRRGLHVVEDWIIRDDGYSGATLDRPGLEVLRDLAYEGELAHLLVYAPDRLARKYAFQVLLLDEFSRNGVEVEFIRSVKGETPEEQLLLQFQGMIAEYERAQIAERSRRGKRHKARLGVVNVLSGAPYGYRYIKAMDHASAYYEIIESEAEIVKQVYAWYSSEGIAMGEIVRRLNDAGTPTRKQQGRWERTSVWGILKNPAYKGRAGYGKTKTVARKKATRKARQNIGFSSSMNSSVDVPPDQWICIPVPALIDEETFDWVQQRLAENRKKSARRTPTPSLLQSLLVCDQCGYALYRTSTRTSSGKKIYYYRCIGSDGWRFEMGKICNRSPIRENILDALVWDHLLDLLKNPKLIHCEIERRKESSRNSSTVIKRAEILAKENARLQNQMNKLIDAYQEELIALEELRNRMPAIRKRLDQVKQEQKNQETASVQEDHLNEVGMNIQVFLDRLNQRVESMGVEEKQKIVRLLIKDVLVGENTIQINHSIPISEKKTALTDRSYLLCTGSPESAVRKYLPERLRLVSARPRHSLCALCRRLRADVSKREGSRTGTEAGPRMDEPQRSHLHPDKTGIVDMNQEQAEFSFLGFRYKRHTNRKGETRRLKLVAFKSLKKLRTSLKELTKRCNGNSLDVIIRKLNQTLRGWYNYFKDCYYTALIEIDQYVRRRLRRILRKRQKRKRGTGRCLQDHKRWPNTYFSDLGLFTLECAS